MFRTSHFARVLYFTFCYRNTDSSYIFNLFFEFVYTYQLVGILLQMNSNICLQITIAWPEKEKRVDRHPVYKVNKKTALKSKGIRTILEG